MPKGRVFFSAGPPAWHPFSCQIEGNDKQKRGSLIFRSELAPADLSAGRPETPKRRVFFPAARFGHFWLQKTIDRIINYKRRCKYGLHRQERPCAPQRLRDAYGDFVQRLGGAHKDSAQRFRGSRPTKRYVQRFNRSHKGCVQSLNPPHAIFVRTKALSTSSICGHKAFVRSTKSTHRQPQWKHRSSAE